MVTKYITIPFDVERAKRISNGEEEGKIVTRDGKEVRIVCFNARHNNYPIVGLIDEGNYESAESFSKNGSYSIEDGELDCDLFLKVPEWTTFKDGDIIYCEVDNGNNSVCKWVSILKGKVECFDGDLYTDEYATYIIESNTCKGEMSFDGYADNIDTIALANEHQKQYLIESLKQSKDPKAKECLKRFFGIEENPNLSNTEKTGKEFELKPFDKVLVRDDDGVWFAGIFLHLRRDGEFFYAGGNLWEQCLPYNDQTKHLLGTTEDWEG